MNNRLMYLLIALAAAVLFVPGLGLVHLFDWDEVNFAEASREMLVSGNYAKVQVEFLPFWEKPPLFFWLQALGMQWFGVSEFAARLPNAVAGIFTLPILFYLGSRYYDRYFGWLWVLSYAGSFTPAFYFKSGIIDPIFNLFIFLSIFQLSCLTDAVRPRQRYWHAVWGGVFIGVAVLAKGPVAVLIVGLCGLTYWLASRSWRTFAVGELLLYGLMTFLVSSLWYLPETVNNGFWFIQEFLDYQLGLATKSEDTGHEQPFWYHAVVLLVGCFPASIFFLGSFRLSLRDNACQRNFRWWMQLQFWITLVLFSVVKAKIIHYSSLCYFPLTYLATHYAYKVWQGEYRYQPWLNVGLGVIGGLWAVVLLALPWLGNHKTILLPYIDDAFTRANLQAQVVWSGSEALAGVVLSIALIIALGWGACQGGLMRAVAMYVGCLVCLQAIQYLIIPRIERYSQGAIIDFLESIAEEDCYISPTNYHSYAHHYYGTVTPAQAAHKRRYLEQHFGRNTLGKQTYSAQKIQWNEYLRSGKIDRPAYLLFKVSGDEDPYARDPQLRKVMDKNGFRVYRREIPKP